MIKPAIRSDILINVHGYVSTNKQLVKESFMSNLVNISSREIPEEGKVFQGIKTVIDAATVGHPV